MHKRGVDKTIVTNVKGHASLADIQAKKGTPEVARAILKDFSYVMA